MRLRHAWLLALAASTVAVVAAAPSSATAADLDCANFSSQAEAQENLLPGDPHGLDADSDGIACESNPCPCSTATGGGGGGAAEGGGATEPPPPPPPYRLSTSAARTEAKRLAQRFVQRNAQVAALAFGGCQRFGARRIDCEFTARGSDPVQRTTCQLRVAVRAKNRHPSPRFAQTRCQSESILVLSYERAKQALLGAATPIAEKRPLLALYRLNRLEFEGVAEWTQALKTPGATERCTLEMLVGLRPSNEVWVETGSPLCAPE